MACRRWTSSATLWASLAACGAVCAQTAPKLEIVSFQLHSFDGGPAWTSADRAHSGDVVHFTFRLAGFTKVEKDNEDRAQLVWTLQPQDAQGAALGEVQRGTIAVEITEKDKKWTPQARGSFVVPLYLRPGDYRLRVTARDELAKTEASAVFPLPVTGPSLRPASEGLGVDNVRFLRSAEGEPLQVAAYRPGDTLWARFDMSGFALTPDREMQLAYGLRIRNAAGRVLLEQPGASEERKKFAYPPAYYPGTLSLEVQPGTAAGTYQLELLLEDRVSGKSASSVHTFRVE